MRKPERLGGLIGGCGLFLIVLIFFWQPVSGGAFLLELPQDENIRDISVLRNKARVSIAKNQPNTDSASAFLIKQETFDLLNTDLHRHLAINRNVVEAANGNLSAELFGPEEAPDWRELIKDPMGGNAHVSFSADGSRYLTVVRGDGTFEAADIIIWDTEPTLKAGLMVSIADLLSAVLSNDGQHVYVQTTDALLVYDAETFGAAEPTRRISTLGEPHTIFSRVGPDGRGDAEYFFLVKQLSLELYTIERAKLSDGSFAPLEPIATAVTRGYAVSSLFDPNQGLMVVVERNRVRAARVDDSGCEFLAEFELDQDAEFRSCTAARASTSDGSGRSMVWALGLRRKVQPPTMRRLGTAEFSALVVGLPSMKGEQEMEVLTPLDWRRCNRWNGYSPRLQFNQDASELIAYTRDKAWTVEVAR